MGAGAAREVAAAQARVADKERFHYDNHRFLQQNDDAGAGSWKEAAQTARQLAELRRAAESAQDAQQQAQQALRESQLEVARLKVAVPWPFLARVTLDLPSHQHAKDPYALSWYEQ